MPSVYSTSSNDIFYGSPKLSSDGLAIPTSRKVLIHGKATVSPGKGLQTPLGVKTDVSQDDLDFLMQDEFFLKHIERGHIVVTGKSQKEADEVAKDMAPYDGSSPKKVEEIIKSTDVKPGGTAAEMKKKASGK